MATTSSNTMAILREIDDAPLGAYHRSVLLRIWRRGICTEPLRALAKGTGMSLGKCQQVIHDLVETNWIVADEHNGREGWRIATAEDLQNTPAETPAERSPHEQNVHHMNADVHHVNASVHHMNADVHHVNAHNRYVNTPLNTPLNACVKSDAPTHDDTPKHLRGFNAMWQEFKPPALANRESLISQLVRNPTDRDSINASAALSLDLNITDDQIREWFGQGGAYWYAISHGRRDGLPPYAKNILSEIAGALTWSRQKTAPAENHPPPASSANEEFFTTF